MDCMQCVFRKLKMTELRDKNCKNKKINKIISLSWITDHGINIKLCVCVCMECACARACAFCVSVNFVWTTFHTRLSPRYFVKSIQFLLYYITVSSAIFLLPWKLVYIFWCIHKFTGYLTQEHDSDKHWWYWLGDGTKTCWTMVIWW